jgi:tRNA-modifying protein YgfZ
MNAPTLLDGSVPLAHLGLIRARGADAGKFLHSQLTTDFAMLGLSQVRLAGFCSAKGRLQASFIAWKLAHDDVLLACAASVLPATLKRLSMFVMRAQCKLSDATAEFRLSGCVGATASGLLGETAVWTQHTQGDAHVIRLPDAAGVARCLLVEPGGSTALPSPALSLDTWRWLEVQSGVATIEASTVEQFVPQMLNLELVGGVDFQKGCYPGQEIVARSQYRGTLKRRMFLFDVDVLATSGQEVFHSGDATQPAGMVANAAPRPDSAAGSSALVEVKLAALNEGSLHLGAPDGPLLRRAELPYSVPIEAAAGA